MKTATDFVVFLTCLVVLAATSGGEWSDWSTWSGCSRTSCGGGVSSQIRICNRRSSSSSSDEKESTCSGSGIRYRICGIQMCKGADTDSVGDVCSALDDVTVGGKSFRLSSSSSSATADDCFVSCLPMDGERAGEPVHLVKANGTRCKMPGSPDPESTPSHSPHSRRISVCLSGECKTVSCDDIVRLKTEAFDLQCEVCGASGGEDGATKCPPKPPSSTADDDDDSRPSKCNGLECPRWIAGQWSDCSVSCGVGLQQRAVVCKRRPDGLDCDSYAKPPTARPCRQPTPCSSYDRSEIWDFEYESAALHGRQDYFGSFNANGKLISDPGRGSEVAAAEYLAPEHQGTPATTPPTATSKHQSEAEEEEATMSSHSTTEQRYKSESALKSATFETDQTSQLPQPQQTQQSYHSVPTASTTAQSTVTVKEPVKEQRDSGLNRPQTASMREPSSIDEEDYSDDFDRRMERWNQSATYDLTEAEYGYNDTDSSHAAYDEFDASEDDEDAEVEERKWRGDGAYTGGPAVENREVKTDPSFVVSDWSRCSATCGTAKRRRQVICKVLLEPSKIVHELPDFRCPGPKPETEDYCSLPECISKPESKTHQWIVTGYGQCSKTCGGGIQEGEVNCLRVPKYFKVDKIRCRFQPLPPPPRRPCNMQPCPPRWSPLPYGPCSASCGGGQQVRQMQCVQNTHDQKTRILPDAQCHGDVPPHASVPCNLIPCPAKWVIGNWLRCSVTCGQGVQTRDVTCEQKLSPDQVVVVDDVSCWQQTDKPDTERPCEAGQCHAINSRSKTRIIRSENSNFIQLRPLRQVPLTVGTNASLLAGSLIVIHCPLTKKKNANNNNNNANNNNNNNNSRVSRVVWLENGRPLDTRRHRRLRVDRHGALRIRNSRSLDAGVYSCVAPAASSSSSSSSSSSDPDSESSDLANTTIRFHTTEDASREMRTRAGLLQGERGVHRASYSEDHVKSFQAELRRLFVPRPKGRASYSGQFLTSKMSTNFVPLQYVPFNWSQCSVECGGGGIQSRDVVCTIIAEDFFLEVDEGFCSDRRLQKPIADRDCGFGRCPHWEPGPWGQCGDENCVQVGAGERRRELRCRSATGERLDADRCRGQPRPKDTETCQNENCVAVWKPSNWTKCSVTCGGRGVKTRSLQCVWRQSKKPVAGSVCLLHQRPHSNKSCHVTTPCPRTGCRDESKYCHMIPQLQMCRFPQYRQECCLSCSLARGVGSPRQITSTHSVSLR